MIFSVNMIFSVSSKFILVPSGKRLHSELERSTMLLMGKLSIEIWPFSSSQTVSHYQAGYLIHGDMASHNPQTLGISMWMYAQPEEEIDKRYSKVHSIQQPGQLLKALKNLFLNHWNQKNTKSAVPVNEGFNRHLSSFWKIINKSELFSPRNLLPEIRKAWKK